MFNFKNMILFCIFFLVGFISLFVVDNENLVELVEYVRRLIGFL